MEYAAKQCLITLKKKVPSPKPLSKLRDQEQPYKPKYQDPDVDDLTKPKYRVVSIGTKKVLICIKPKPSNIIKIIRSDFLSRPNHRGTNNG